LVDKKKSHSTQSAFVQCDLEFPPFQNKLKDLEETELDAFLKKIETINRMTWTQIYATSSKGAEKRGLSSLHGRDAPAPTAFTSKI
jgi:hypothetical protein